MLDFENFTNESVIEHFDSKIDSEIHKLLNIKRDYAFTIKDLHMEINEDETLIEYIRATEYEYKLPAKSMSDLTDEELNKYVAYLDSLWEV